MAPWSLCLLIITFEATINGSHHADRAFHESRILLKFSPTHAQPHLESLSTRFGAFDINSYALVPGLVLLSFVDEVDIEAIKEQVLSEPGIVYAEPDFLFSVLDTSPPDDTYFPKQWSLENAGENGGQPDEDINALLTWEMESGHQETVVAIVDTGVEAHHEDLADNLFHNTQEVPNNGIDDDGNGYIDDVHGINAIANDGAPIDDHGHGTHVAGIIGATGGNGKGISGVAQHVSMLACKFISRAGSGFVSDAIKCLQYLANLKTRPQDPINLVATNNSWGGGQYSQALFDAIDAHRELGILFIAAAGNDRANNDRVPKYPADYDLPNIISVGATNRAGTLAHFTNYGARSVDVAAPGEDILSTYLNNSYRSLSGTSMAAPHVTGLSALIRSIIPSLSFLGTKFLIMAGGKPLSASADSIISGRIIRGADISGIGALTCAEQSVRKRLAPVEISHKMAVGDSLFLSAINIDCNGPAGPITLFDDLGIEITLNDDGQNGDNYTDDGVYSTEFKPIKEGNYLLRFSASDQVMVRVYPDNSYKNYEIKEVPFRYEIVDGIRLGASDESMHHIVSPFPIQFSFYEGGFKDLFISSNGTVSFTDDLQPGYANQPLPLSKFKTLIAVYWDDLIPRGANSDIYVGLVGTYPNRKLIVTWWFMSHFDASGSAYWQVVFYENSPNIQANYWDTGFQNPAYNNGRSATIGVQIDNGLATQYSFNGFKKIGPHQSLLFLSPSFRSNE